MEKPKEIEDFNTSPYVEYPGIQGCFTKEDPDTFMLTLDNGVRLYPKEYISDLFTKLFQEVKHGDQEHQDWLENKIKDFVSKELK